MILYTVPGSCSFASHIALEMAGADYEVRLAPRAGGRTAESFFEINPKGRVPALVTAKGVLTETPAILYYIAQTCSQTDPKRTLAPMENPWLFARLQSFCAYLCATVHVAHAHGHRGYRWADEESSFKDMTNKVPQNMGECFRLIESEMLQGPWVLGEIFSIADIYLLAIARWLEADKVDTSDLVNVLDHRARMLQLPEVQVVLAQEQKLTL
ncbi:MAG: glutathione S-transferase [Candidatus Azotimanducaceae bacterium]|jgi:glutathione S-transferase